MAAPIIRKEYEVLDPNAKSIANAKVTTKSDGKRVVQLSTNEAQFHVDQGMLKAV